MFKVKESQQDVVARAYRELNRDFDLLQRALGYLRLHHPDLNPSSEDVVWAANYVRDYDEKIEHDAPEAQAERQQHFKSAYAPA